MKDPKDISFVRVDILENWRFWNEYRNRLEDAGREVIEQADAMLSQDLTRNERAARLMSESIAFRKKKQEAGKAGGTAKATNSKNSDAEQAGGAVDSNTITHTTAALPANHQPPANVIVALNSRKSAKPAKVPSTTELYDFAHLEGIDDSLAREWYDMTISRNWCDRDGNKIKNWKAACRSYVTTRIQKLNSQQEG